MSLFSSILLNAALSLASVDTSYELLVGSYTKEGNPGIEVFDVAPGYSHAMPRYGIKNPNSSFLAVSPDGKFLYSVREEGKGNSSLSAFQRSEKGEYVLMNAETVEGSGPCHVAYHAASGAVYVANYGSGSLSVFRTSGGRLLPLSQHIRYTGTGPDKSRQEAPHAHQVVVSPDQKFIFVNDLGTDKIHRHTVRPDGTVEEKPVDVRVTPGAGPRHLTFNTKGDRAYLINEMSGMVDVFRFADGNLMRMQSVLADTAKAASKGSADIHLSPNGKWLLASNRVSSNQVVVFAVQADGSLKKVGHQEVARRPRNFNFTPDGRHVLVASQEEHRVQVFSFNDADGSMKDTKMDIAVKMPVCLVFLPGKPRVDPEERIRTLGIQLIPPTPPIANYVKAVRSGNLVFLSGHGPDKPEGGQIFGKLGKDLTIEQGQAAARLTVISLISTLKAYVGDLNRVKRVVKVMGLVNCVDGFGQQPAVMNGCSNLLVDIFGEKGKHARTSVGVNALPNNIAVEIEMVVEVE
jgi:6-phosphogluconolactonase (cycloisomerase 2 family)/enamine deaminase RidA (YjgF/YER057c/UK114 family)